MKHPDSSMDPFMRFWFALQEMFGIRHTGDQTIARLRRLKEAVDAGLISEADYDQQIDEILRGM